MIIQQQRNFLQKVMKLKLIELSVDSVALLFNISFFMFLFISGILYKNLNTMRLLCKERELRESVDEKRSRNLAELSLITDKEKELQYDLRLTQDALREEKNKSERLLDQVVFTKLLLWHNKRISAALYSFKKMIALWIRLTDIVDKRAQKHEHGPGDELQISIK